MRLTVIGASGGIGRELVRQGLAAGHEVTAVVRESAGSSAALRDWEKVPAGGPGRLHVAVVDSLSADGLAGAVAGQDAVAVAIGPRGRTSDPTINSRGVRAVVEAMRATGVRRIVAVSAAPLFAEGPLLYRKVVRPLLWAAFRTHYADLQVMEEVLAGSGTDWTVVRPPKLTNRAGSGRPGLVLDRAGRGGMLARADVATAMLQVLADPASVAHSVGVGSH